MGGDEQQAAARLERRRARLLTELQDERVRLFTPNSDGRVNLGGEQLEAEPLMQVLVDELAYARQPPVHEQRRSSYGGIVLANPAWLTRLGEVMSAQNREATLIELAGDDPASRNLSAARALANGRTTFLVRSLRGAEVLIEIDVGDELTLALLARRNIFTVQRTPAGAVKVFAQKQLYVNENDQWWAKPYADSRLADLERLFVRGSPTASSSLVPAAMSKLLQFCLHILSARHIGATLVWFPMHTDPFRTAKKSLGKDRGEAAAAALQVDTPRHLEPFATLLAGIDGACILNQAGQLVRVGVKLASKQKTTKLIAPDRGTRHTSAKRFSFDTPESLVFVVSHDGPVTLYSDGMSMLQFHSIGTRTRTWMRTISLMSSVAAAFPLGIEGVIAGAAFAAAGAVAADFLVTYSEATCPKCGKRFEIEKLRSVGSAERLTIECPVCGSAEIASDNKASRLLAYPIKPWMRPPMRDQSSEP